MSQFDPAIELAVSVLGVAYIIGCMINDVVAHNQLIYDLLIFASHDRIHCRIYCQSGSFFCILGTQALIYSHIRFRT